MKERLPEGNIVFEIKYFLLRTLPSQRNKFILPIKISSITLYSQVLFLFISSWVICQATLALVVKKGNQSPNKENTTR